MAITQELKGKWVAALRSGKYAQTKNVLYSGKGYCCLGVLGAVSGVSTDRLIGATRIRGYGRKFMLGQNICTILATMNDKEDKSFAEIADWIEINLQ